jgi:large subunit ribosomal protein L13
MTIDKNNFTKFDLNKTLFVKPKLLEKNRKRYLIDAKGKTLGKVAVEIAKRLIWKYNPYYCDHWDSWDFVIVVNADKIKVTWKKLDQKLYYRHSWYKWNLKSFTLKWMLTHRPERVLWLAVRKMLPKNKLRDRRMKRLKIFIWENHKFGHLPLEKIEINE